MQHEPADFCAMPMSRFNFMLETPLRLVNSRYIAHTHFFNGKRLYIPGSLRDRRSSPHLGCTLTGFAASTRTVMISTSTRLQVFPCFIEANAIVRGSLTSFGCSNGRWLSASRLLKSCVRLRQQLASQHLENAGVVSHQVQTYSLGLCSPSRLMACLRTLQVAMTSGLSWLGWVSDTVRSTIPSQLVMTQSRTYRPNVVGELSALLQKIRNEGRSRP